MCGQVSSSYLFQVRSAFPLRCQDFRGREHIVLFPAQTHFRMLMSCTHRFCFWRQMSKQTVKSNPQEVEGKLSGHECSLKEKTWRTWKCSQMEGIGTIQRPENKMATWGSRTKSMRLYNKGDEMWAGGLVLRDKDADISRHKATRKAYFLLKVMSKFWKIPSIGAVWLQKDPLGYSIKNNLNACEGGEGVGRGQSQTKMGGERTTTNKQTNKQTNKKWSLFQDLNLERSHWIEEIWGVESAYDLMCD